MEILFPFSEYYGFYITFTLFVLLVLAVDLGVFHRDAHEVKFKEALSWTVVWIGLAAVFNVAFYYYCLHQFSTDPRFTSLPDFNAAAQAKTSALEFLTGYVVEKSLAVDNVFVFVVVFNYFAIPLKYQHRVLFFGIMGALIFRAIFIALGSVLMQYKAIVIFFGVFLIITGIKLLFAPEKPLEPEKNPVVRLLKKFFKVTPNLEGQKFFVRKSDGLYITPLFIALVFLEVTDIIFAVDSVPAIFALTKEPLIVFTSNIFAILGLRAMYFLLAGVMDKFHYLRLGLGVILVFVGLKMTWLNEAFGGKFPIGISLGIISGVLAISVIASLLFPKKSGLE